MNSRRANSTSNIAGILISIAVVVLVLVLVYATPLLSWVSRTVHSIGGQIWESKEIAKDNVTHNSSLITSSKTQLIERINRLEKEVAYYEANHLRLTKLEQENKRLRGVQSETKDDVIGRVISRPPQSLYDTLVLDIPAKATVREETPVTGYNAVALGTIARTTKRTAVVTLYSMPGRSVQVSTVPGSAVFKAKGRGNGSFIVKIPRSVSVEKGSQLIHENTGRLLATVEKVTFESEDSFKTVYAKSPLRLRYIDWVRVLPR